MGAEDSITAPAVVRCGSCDTSNLGKATYCKGCGQGLYEPCAGCAKPVLLTQRFCESCGADLQQALRKRYDHCDTRMSEAVQAAKESDFEHAIAILTQLAEVQDYRFRESVENAKRAIEKIEGLRDRAMTMAAAAMANAKRELQNGNQQAVVKLLETVPPNLLTDDARKDLERSKAFVKQLSTLEAELKAGIANKDWPLVGGLIDRLLDLVPKEEQYRKLGKQVSEKLITAAKRSLSASKYTTASALLNAVPEIGRNREFDQIRDSVEDIQWLSQQFDPEPYATPLLGRLAVRFAKEAADNPQAQRLVKQLASRLKSGQRPPRMHLPTWKGATNCWMGGTAGMLSFPTSLDLGDQELLRSRPGRFSIAIGLALQGLGESRTVEHFAPRKGLLGRLGRRKNTTCWGIDIGAASMKAVCLEKGEDGIEVVDSFFEEFETPLCRASLQEDQLSVIGPVVERFLEQSEIEGIPLWGNVTGGQLITRFVRLPPVKDKQASALLNQEIEQKIPVPTDELAVACWLSTVRGDNEVHGRPAVITAARQSFINQRLELFNELGLTLSGLQADSTALANFAAYEFADVLSPAQGDESDESEIPLSDASKTPAIAILDCGAATTNFVIVSGETYWSWTRESAGEDLTTALARATKTTHAEADKHKRNPAALDSPSRHYQAVEQKQDELRSRLQTILIDALNQNKRFEIVQSWCVGGGCLAHQWMRRLMIESSREEQDSF